MEINSGVTVSDLRGKTDEELQEVVDWLNALASTIPDPTGWDLEAPQDATGCP